jgi:gamma-glutamylcyclotransferase (GGCT)/AIG2-like uncharacterized protein YtfP
LRQVTSVRLFVYGSLKRRGQHHAELAGSRFLAEAETEPGHVLTALGSYLALECAGESQGRVKGELFEVAEALLPALDEFEGEAYERRKVALSAEHSRGFREALAYFRKAR